MRSLRVVAATLVLALIAFACGGDDEEGPEPEQEPVTTSTRATPDDEPPSQSTAPTTSSIADPPEEGGELEPPPTTEPAPIATPSTEPAHIPTNLKCLAGTREGELLVEWDAVSNPANISKFRLYVSEDGGPYLTNGHFRIDEVDTTRASGTRWAAPVRGLPANVPLRFRVTSFNLLEQESLAHFVNGVYSGPGQPCSPDGPVLPPTTCTAGCDEEEGEPAP